MIRPKCGGMAEAVCVNMVCIELRSQDTCSPWDQCKKVFNKFWKVSKVSAPSNPNNWIFDRIIAYILSQSYSQCGLNGFLTVQTLKPLTQFSQVFSQWTLQLPLIHINCSDIHIICTTLVSIHGYLHITWPFCNNESSFIELFISTNFVNLESGI